MMKIKISLQYYLIVFLIITTACSVTGSDTNSQDTEHPNLALTITAQAFLLEHGSQPSAQPTIQVQDTSLPAFTSTPQPTSAPEFTVTPSVTTVTVTLDTNCRTGPGTQYEQIDALLVGQPAKVVGKNTSTSYWIIEKPNGSGTCWLWGQYATVSGNTSSLTEYAIPATPTTIPTAVAAITELQAINISCSQEENNQIGIHALLLWRNNSNDVSGIRIYNVSQATMLELLLPNTTNFEFFEFTEDGTVIMGVQPFNSNGPIDQFEITVRCP